MTSRLVILRPDPGASRTAHRAKAAGWAIVRLPLFAIAALPWDPPDPTLFDAILMTSANSALPGGADLSCFHHLPLYAVGAQTADAARDSGFATIIAGETGVAGIADRLRADAKVRIFHPGGEVRRAFDETGLHITSVAVYAARPVTPPRIADAIGDAATILVHSPRSAHYLDRLCTEQSLFRSAHAIVAISEAALAAVGQGWGAAEAAERPTDEAMLATAYSLGGAEWIG